MKVNEYSQQNLGNIKFKVGPVVSENIGFMTFYGIFLEIWSGNLGHVSKNYFLRA